MDDASSLLGHDVPVLNRVALAAQHLACLRGIIPRQSPGIILGMMHLKDALFFAALALEAHPSKTTLAKEVPLAMSV